MWKMNIHRCCSALLYGQQIQYPPKGLDEAASGKMACNPHCCLIQYILHAKLCWLDSGLMFSGVPIQGLNERVSYINHQVLLVPVVN
jgi:hypothetical protein